MTCSSLSILMRTLTEQAQNPQSAIQAVMESTAEAQRRNVNFAQNVM